MNLAHFAFAGLISAGIWNTGAAASFPNAGIILSACAALAAQEHPVRGSSQLQVLDTSIASPWLKTIGDLDGDGRTDIVVGGAKSGGLVAYLNRFPKWERREPPATDVRIVSS